MAGEQSEPVQVSIVYTNGTTQVFPVDDGTSISLSDDGERLMFVSGGQNWTFRLANIAGYGVN